MTIDLTGEEITALANHLAEKRTQKAEKMLRQSGIKIDKSYFALQFDFYMKVLEETNDY